MDFLGHPLLRKVMVGLVFLMGINVLAVDIFVFYQVFYNKNSVQSVFLPSTSTTPSPTPTVPQDSCSQSCLTAIKEATASTSLSNLQPTPSPSSNASSGQTTTKEQYIPIGTGVSKSSDWEDIVGAQVYVNSKSFGRIKKVTFEATVRVPDRVEDVYVRLYNATDQHQVWFSDLFFPSGTTSNFLISDPIQLDEGNKLYKVQMKTQLKSPANLDLARFHIVAE